MDTRKLRLTPSMAVSLAALVLAGSGGAYAATSATGARAKHKPSSKQLTKSQILALIDSRLKKLNVAPGATGASGPTGASGSPGSQGTIGLTGPQGPGAKLLSYDSSTPQATATPTSSTLGTLGPFTFGASCSTSAGTLVVVIYYSGPAFTVDGTITNTEGGTSTSTAISGPYPAAATLTPLSGATSPAGVTTAHSDHLTLTTPSGSIQLSFTAATVNTASPTCHISLVGTPLS